MKEYQEQVPLIVVGGKAGDFLGEYMAGGTIVVLGLPDGIESIGNYCGTGMHAGKMFIRGEMPNYKLGREVVKSEPTDEDGSFLDGIIRRYTQYFNRPVEELENLSFTKLTPMNSRPYGNMYVKY